MESSKPSYAELEQRIEFLEQKLAVYTHGHQSDIPHQPENRLEEYVHVVEATRDFMAVLDEERRYTLANSSLLYSRGLGREQVIGRYIWEVVGRKIYELYLKDPLDRCYQGEIVRFEIEFDFVVIGPRALEIKFSPQLSV